MQTDREVLVNRPDIIIKNKKDKTWLLIDVAILSDKNIIQKEAEKKLKYKNVSKEIQIMWNIIIGATGIVSKSLQKYLETIPGQHSIDSVQKTAILGTSYIIRKVLQAET
jgi:glycine cleavage system protein P-like pyridoxal-binding family